MATGDLTTLSRFKQYAEIKSNGEDPLLTRLISAASSYVKQYLNRASLLPADYSETYRGTGMSTLMLKNYPIISVASVALGSMPLTPSPDKVQLGYYVDNDRTNIQLAAPGKFPTNSSDVLVQYRAGLLATQSSAVPGAPYEIVPDTLGFAVLDQGVTDSATGAALVAVSGTPLTGQYSYADGTYTFAQADQGRGVTMSYGYVPFDVEQVCVEIAHKRYLDRKRQGQKSASLQGQNISYDMDDMTATQKGMLASYRRVTPT